MDNIIIFDTEIKHGIATDYNPPKVGYRYAEGWKDFAGMGVSVIGAFDFTKLHYRVFCEDNFDAWRELTERSSRIVSFNGDNFDNPLLDANGLGFDPAKSLDLAALIWALAGVPAGEHPKGLGLDALCKANNIEGKSGNSADAPQHWQDGKVGTVIDYCLGDVRATVDLYYQIILCGYITDPRTLERLPVRLPR